MAGGIKRWFDIAGTLTAILLLLPPFCLIALAIKFWDRGPVFYRARRTGLDGRSLDCLKFRFSVGRRDGDKGGHLHAGFAQAIDRLAPGPGPAAAFVAARPHRSPGDAD